MRAIAGAIIFLAGIILWGLGNVALNLPAAGYASFAMIVGILTAIIGAILAYKGWNESGWPDQPFFVTKNKRHHHPPSRSVDVE